MARKATLDDLRQRVLDAIEADEDWLGAVAADFGQMLDNVKHMKCFRIWAAHWLTQTTKKYEHLDANLVE